MGVGGAARKPVAPATVLCVICKKDHERKACITLTNCGHTAGRTCVEGIFNQITPSTADKRNAACPTCQQYISWTDLQHAVAMDKYAALARRLHGHMVRFWAQPSMRCCESQSPCSHNILRPSYVHLGRDPAAVTIPADAFYIRCMHCRAFKCAACGTRFSADAHTPNLHTCTRTVLLRCHLYLEAMRAADPSGAGAGGGSQPTKKRKQASKTVWSKGTGYGGDAGSTVAASELKEAKARQDAQDRILTTAFTGLTKELAAESARNVSPPSLPPPPPISTSSSLPSSLPPPPSASSSLDDDLLPSVLLAAPVRAPSLLLSGEDAIRLQALIADSCLHDILRSLLWNNSSSDITSRLPLYRAVMALIALFGTRPLLTSHLNSLDPFSRAWAKTVPTPVPESSVAPLSPAIKAGGKETKATKGKRGAKRQAEEPPAPIPQPTPVPEGGKEAEGEGEEEVGKPLVELMALQDKQARIFLQQSRGAADLTEAVALSETIRATHKALLAGLQGLPHHLKGERPIRVEEKHEGVAAATASPADTASEDYLAALRPLLFHPCNIDYGVHAFKQSIEQSLSQPIKRERTTHIVKEITALANALPIALGSSIFVRVDEERQDVLKALITGPADTPYQNGCFVFDIFLPVSYPQIPPQVRLMTTDGGRVRFNPNLYACGKVCLSLLGTWQGPGWDPAVSTLLQVLVSIQSLIMVPDPFYNEPGFDARQSKNEADRYNGSLRYHTLAVAMLRSLREPVPEFRSVIRTHFQTKKDEIRRQCQAWLADAVARDSFYQQNTGAHDQRYVSMAHWTHTVKALEAELDKFEPIETITLD